MDLDDLRAKAAEDVACLMLTNPNTLGLFDENIAEIAEIVHGVGGDALLRRRQPQRDHGLHTARRHGVRHRPPEPAQVVQPAARRGRPGFGADRGLRPDRSRSCRCRGSSATPTDPATATAPGLISTSTTTSPKSIGRLRGFQGNFGVFVRSYAYISSLGGDGLQRGLGDRGPERQLSAREAAGRACAAGTCRSRSSARRCTSSSSRARRQARARRARPWTSPSGCSTSAFTRRRSTSRCWSTRR